MSDTKKRILVLGGYGLAGRSVVNRFLKETDYEVTAAGRDLEKLRATFGKSRQPLKLEQFDVLDTKALRKACGRADLVVNAVGPYGKTGARTAQTVIESGVSYLDCASEQVHFSRLKALDAPARDRNLLLVTGAGFIPGISGLLVSHMLQRTPDAREADASLAQLRHAYADSGVASMMTGILDGMEQPVAMRDGKPSPVVIGESLREMEMPAPFGKLRMIEAPSIEDLVLPARYPLRNLHTWYYLGDTPVWILRLIRVIRPDKWEWSFHLVESITKKINARSTTRAIERGLGPEAILHVSVRSDREEHQASIVFRDGAVATAVLPVMIARDFLEGRVARRGLATPLDLLDPGTALRNLGDAALKIDIPQ